MSSTGNLITSIQGLSASSGDLSALHRILKGAEETLRADSDLELSTLEQLEPLLDWKCSSLTNRVPVMFFIMVIIVVSQSAFVTWHDLIVLNFVQKGKVYGKEDPKENDLCQEVVALYCLGEIIDNKRTFGSEAKNPKPKFSFMAPSPMYTDTTCLEVEHK
ncbi:hypothetical protein HID58_028854 [Brassica napus]|uniref:Uncharacterized protein n=1 Tax=Brassica napus TaxID=3708 RepID=A0ABQ8CCY1_BRANA|nr:hypothetical protein HID58_028854 [Brassica napus]